MAKQNKKVSKYWDEASTVKGATPPPSDPYYAQFVKPVKVNTLKQAKKLLSRLIYQLQIDKIESKKAKDLTYLLSVFISIVKEGELEARLTALEERLGNGNGLND